MLERFHVEYSSGNNNLVFVDACWADTCWLAAAHGCVESKRQKSDDDAQEYNDNDERHFLAPGLPLLPILRT